MRSRKEPANEYGLRLCQADQARSDFAAIGDDLEFIMGQLAKVPTRRDLAWVALAAFLGGAGFAIFVNLIVGR